jgi:hypothetical protein
MNKFLLFSFSIFLSIVIVTCTEEGVNNPIGNQPPNTGMFLYPDSTISPQQSRLTVHWWGDDIDGLIIGYYFSWNDDPWQFTASNDSLFALQIGANDTTYTFRVSAVDNGGNNVYDQQVFQNGIDFGPEPFIDQNANGIYNEGEFFYDIGSIDPTPASFDFPLRNTAPKIKWSELSFLPDTSFSVMTFSWIAEDLDGDETITAINIALNDTTNQSGIISLDGSVRTVTVRTDDFSTDTPLMEILIESQEGNIFPELLPGLILNSNNKFFVQSVDISGAKSKFISLPDTGATWYVKKPVGKLLIIDDHALNDNTAAYYNIIFNSMGLAGKYDIYDIHTQTPPFLNVTFLETIKLFDYLFWYTDNFPSIDLASFSTDRYLTAGGKVAFSMQFPQTVDPLVLSSFIPIIPDSIDERISLLPGTIVASDVTEPSYPNLETTISIFRVKSFYLNPLVANPIYYYPNGEMKGFAGFTNSSDTEFFIALPLSKCDGGNANVKPLLEKIFFEDFGLVP